MFYNRSVDVKRQFSTEFPTGRATLFPLQFLDWHKKEKAVGVAVPTAESVEHRLCEKPLQPTLHKINNTKICFYVFK